MSDIFEIAMMVLFGLSWPLNVIKSIKTRSAKGKSPIGLALIVSAYLCGITAKLIAGNVNRLVLFFYILNCTMVSLDLILYFINRKREKRSFHNENNGSAARAYNACKKRRQYKRRGGKKADKAAF